MSGVCAVLVRVISRIFGCNSIWIEAKKMTRVGDEIRLGAECMGE